MSELFDPYYAWLGIPPTEQPPDHYRLLGIERFEDDPGVIAAAADRQMAFVRGLQVGQQAAAAQRLLNELTAARTCLLHVAEKTRYDAALRSQLAPGTAADRKIARPAPRSPTAPPGGMAPSAGSGPPSAPAPGTAMPGATWPGASYGPPVPLPGAPAGYTGPPPGSPGPGTPPGYAAPPSPAPSPPGPPSPPPPSPPVDSPPIASTGIAPQNPVIVSADSPAGASALDRESNEPSRQRQFWLLLAIVGVVVVGTGLTVLIIASGGVSDRGDNDADTATEQMTAMRGNLVVQQPSGALDFSATDAVIHGDTARLGTVSGRGVITHWTSPRDWLSWDFRVEQPAMFRTELIYAAPEAGGKFSVSIDDKQTGDMKKEASVRGSGGAATFANHEIGFLTVRRSGRYQLTMRVVSKPAGQLMILRAVRLTRYDVGHVR